MTSMAEKIAREKARVYCLQYDKDTRDASYFFLKLDPAKESAFLKALDGSSATQESLEDFGEVVASGWGKIPTRVRETLSEKYALTFHDE